MSDGIESLISDEFMKQFSGSAAANGITVAVFGLFMLLKKMCDRPSKCKSHLHCGCRWRTEVADTRIPCLRAQARAHAAEGRETRDKWSTQAP